MKDDNFLRANNAQHMWHPMGHPGEAMEQTPTIIETASGSTIKDIDGHETIDAVGGLWCVNLGYSNDVVKDAIAKQLYDLPYYSAFAGTSNPSAIEASYAVREFFAEDGMARVFFTSGGSDSVETCLRLARQYHRIKGEPNRTKFLSLKKGYHGTHFGGASVNGNNRFRINYEPLLPGCFHMPSPYTYRNPFNETDAAILAQNIAAAMEDEIVFQGAGSIAAFIMEPVQGAGGVIVPNETFMPLMRDICDRHGILMIADEVITGFGRTGNWFACETLGIEADLMTIAKGLSSGYMPIGGVLISERVAKVVIDGGEFTHGYTYSGHPVAAAVASANVSIIENEGMIEQVRDVTGPYLQQRLAELLDHPLVGQVRGIGLMAAIELVQDKESHTNYPKEVGIGGICRDYALENGLVMRAVGDSMIMCPPLIISKLEIDELVEKTKKSLDQTLTQVEG